jgi:hypothetical protein
MIFLIVIKFRSLLILLLLLLLLVPVYFLNRWLKRSLRPRESALGFGSYLLLSLALAFGYTFAVVWIIFRLFPLPLK